MTVRASEAVGQADGTSPSSNRSRPHTNWSVPTLDTPLLVNVTGDTFSGQIPNLSNLTSGSAPFVLWNFPDATSVTVTGGATLEGSIYAPNADLNWQVTQNIEGNVIAKSIIHDLPAAPTPGTPREGRCRCVS